MTKKLAFFLVFASIITCGVLTSEIFAQEETPKQSSEKKATATDQLEKINKSLGKLVKLPKGDVWIETTKKIVVIDGMICLRKGPLEMLACPVETKEHESIIQVQADSHIVHTGLLMVGATPGSPVVWEPKYRAANGSKIEVTMHWLDEDGKHKKLRAQELIRNVKTRKSMTEEWVFSGSEFYTNPKSKIKHYMADGGEMICVANFTTAMMDLPIESSQSRDGLIFEAFTEKIPPVKTKVRLVLKPVPIKKKAEKKEKDKQKVDEEKSDKDNDGK